MCGVIGLGRGPRGLRLAEQLQQLAIGELGEGTLGGAGAERREVRDVTWPLRLGRRGDGNLGPELPRIRRVRRQRLEPLLELDLLRQPRGLGAVRHLGGALRELDEQPRIFGVAVQPDPLPACLGELAELPQRIHVLRLILRGHAHARGSQDFRHAHTAPSGNSCSSFLTSARNLSASAPSTTRWSYDIVSIPIVRMAMDSVPSAAVTTLGRFSIAPTPRIATCGWLMIGIPANGPKPPGLVIVNVPRWMSLGSSFLVRARSPRSLIARAMPMSDSSSACLITGTMRHQSSATAIPMLTSAR